MAKAGQPVCQLPGAGEVWLDNADEDKDDCNFCPGGCHWVCRPITAVVGERETMSTWSASPELDKCLLLTKPLLLSVRVTETKHFLVSFLTVLLPHMANVQ